MAENVSGCFFRTQCTLHGLQFRRYGSIFIRLASVGSQSREITRNSAKIWPYSSSRSSKVIGRTDVRAIAYSAICNVVVCQNMTVAS